MNDFRQILFPVDFSPRCTGTVPFVKEMVRTWNAALTLLQVVEIPIYAYGNPEGAIVWDSFEDYNRIGMENLGDFACKQFGDLAKTHSVETVCDRGDPGYAILAQAEKSHADLIMMPTHGDGPFRSFVVGSSTVRVLHRAPCAVWTGAHLENESAQAHVGITRILCALDLEHDNAAVLKAAAAIAKKFDAELRLVHCVPVPEGGPAEEFLSEFDRFLADSAREKLSKLQSASGTAFEVTLEGGHISKVVRDAAVRHRADLVVIGRGHAQVPLSRLRTNAYAIVREAPCPVLSV
jgi:nucleotide-binding universal stress UspA family protein